MKDQDQIEQISHQLNRREFLKGSVLGLGSVAMGAFTVWMAGGGIRKGYSQGEKDEVG